MLAILTLACGSPPADRPAPANDVPRARLMSPVQIAAGAPALFDAADSFDPDGALVAWRFVFGDGSAASDVGVPRAWHAFAAEGLFEVGLTVRDDQGAEARARQTVRVAASTLACESDTDCVGEGGSICHGGACAWTGGGLD